MNSARGVFSRRSKTCRSNLIAKNKRSPTSNDCWSKYLGAQGDHMKNQKVCLLAIICSLGLLAGDTYSLAQEREEATAKHQIDLISAAFEVSGSRHTFGKVVKGEPYSATAITESTQTLADGKQLIRKNETRIYRD